MVWIIMYYIILEIKIENKMTVQNIKMKKEK